jgi:hypothetical protein
MSDTNKKGTLNKALTYAALGGLCAVMLTAGMRYEQIKRGFDRTVDRYNTEVLTTVLERFPTPEQTGKAYLILKAAEIKAGREETADSIDKTLCGIINNNPTYSCGYRQEITAMPEPATDQVKKEAYPEPSTAEIPAPAVDAYIPLPATPLIPIEEPVADVKIEQQEPMYDSEGKDLCVKELESLLKTLEKEGRTE